MLRPAGQFSWGLRERVDTDNSLKRLRAASSRDHRMNVTDPKTKQLFSKVPEVTLFFWIIKVLCTTVGETAADFINVNLNLGLTITSVIMGVLFAIALVIQFKTKKYIPVVYWVT